MPALRAEGIVARYGANTVVRGVSVTIEDGSLAAMVGPNGAGKSTFVKAVSGVLPPAAGEVHVGDEDLTGLPPHQIVR
ncbi:MAG: ATP-binding cassette domain-containing protein, partial [Acidimicrobiales bacterium]